MRPVLRAVIAATTFLFLLPLDAFARGAADTDHPVPTSTWSDFISKDRPESATSRFSPLAASAVVTTTVLNSSKFDSGASCTAQSWTTVDLTAQTGDYWHVDDFAQDNALGSLGGKTTTGEGTTFAPVQGSKSMWMGQRMPPAGPVDPIYCGYSSLPGYGNQWDQSFCSKACLSTSGGPTSNLDVAFKLKFDTQPSYDGTVLEYTTDCSGNTDWTEIDGGYTAAGWSGATPGLYAITVAHSYAVGAGPVKVRLHFTSDRAWSNQDGLYPGLGVVVDSLSWEGTPVEDFEGEAIGAHSSEDWESCNRPGFGNYLALFKKVSGADYEDPCLSNLGCYWAALQGSTDFYSCGSPSQPAQKVVPYKNAIGTPGTFLTLGNQYIANEIWSPVIPISGSGSEFRLRYTVYRDLPLDNLVFHYWRVRAFTDGCPGPWSHNGSYYYGDSKDWAIAEYSIGSRINLVTTANSLQVSLGVIDLCSQWCGTLGSGACHSPAPYFDSVQVLHVDTAGPQWEVRDVDMFQDTFSVDGTLTGLARADAALDVKPAASATITPGDSAVVIFLADPHLASGNGTLSSGLLADPIVSTFVGRHKTKRRAYMYVSVWPQGQSWKTGAVLSEGPGGQANRYPFMGTQVIAGNTWTKIRMDYTYKGSATNPGDGHPAPNAPQYVGNRFNVDLNDNLFTPGDTVGYFFSASSEEGTNYFSTEFGTTTDINAIAANPMEFTILPAGGYNHGGDILYVDGADGLGNQPYFDGAFMVLGLAGRVDRYDVRAPGSVAGNRLGSRVTNVATQLNAAYRRIIWDCGDLATTLADGTGSAGKGDDYAVLNTFLGNLTNAGGVYIGGDDVAEVLNSQAGASAATFRSTYMPFTLISANHRLAPTSFQISPTIKAWPGRFFDDNFFVFGGCPQLNDFDVIGANGTTQVQMSYNTALDPDGAVVWHAQGNARVLLSGFSLATVRDDELDGVSDRGRFIFNTLCSLGSDCTEVGVGPALLANSLAQNYPNPFNPQTSISFSIAKRADVRLVIYDVSGALVRTLANETRAAGAYEITWDGRDSKGQQVSSGVYFYRLVAGRFTQTKKMVLLK